MPRIYNSASEPLDFCFYCFPRHEVQAREEYAGTKLGPDGRGDCFDYDSEHPPYEEFYDPKNELLSTAYHCHSCGDTLTEDDDHLN